MAALKDKPAEERRAAMRKMMAGVDAVGIGRDYDGVGCEPEGLDDVSKWKIYGGNLLRVMRAVEKTAAASATF